MSGKYLWDVQTAFTALGTPLPHYYHCVILYQGKLRIICLARGSQESLCPLKNKINNNISNWSMKY